MAQTKTLDANQMARALSTPKRVITDKAVRGMARSIIARFDKTRHPAYQSHDYTPAEQATLRKAFSERGSRSRSRASVAKVVKRAKSPAQRTVKAVTPAAGPDA